MSKSYPFATIVGMARIPADRFDAFMAELAALMDHIRFVVALSDAKGEPDEAIMQRLARLDWLDDDREQLDVTMHGIDDYGAEVFTAEFHQNMRSGHADASFKVRP